VSAWWSRLTWSQAAMVLLALFLLADVLYIAASEWRRRVILRRQQRCLRINRDYRRSIEPHHSTRRNSTQAVT
jgi:thiosulfate reductase cytochrome b subunit